jgi:hypothetical protein
VSTRGFRRSRNGAVGAVMSTCSHQKAIRPAPGQGVARVRGGRQSDSRGAARFRAVFTRGKVGARMRFGKQSPGRERHLARSGGEAERREDGAILLVSPLCVSASLREARSSDGSDAIGWEGGSRPPSPHTTGRTGPYPAIPLSVGASDTLRSQMLARGFRTTAGTWLRWPGGFRPCATTPVHSLPGSARACAARRDLPGSS